MPRRRSGRKIDFTHWTGFNASTVSLASGATAGVTLANAQHLPETNLRTRGQALASFVGAGAAGILARFGIGFILVPEGTGTTVLWSPLTDTDAPWFYYLTGNVFHGEAVTDVLGYSDLGGVRETIDSKAMRIVKNMEIQVVFEQSGITGTQAMNMAVAGRFLSGT